MKKPKKDKKLELNKVTLRNLDEPQLQAVAGGSVVCVTKGRTCCRTSCF